MNPRRSHTRQRHSLPLTGNRLGVKPLGVVRARLLWAGCLGRQRCREQLRAAVARCLEQARNSDVNPALIAALDRALGHDDLLLLTRPVPERLLRDVFGGDL